MAESRTRTQSFNKVVLIIQKKSKNAEEKQADKTVSRNLHDMGMRFRVDIQ